MYFNLRKHILANPFIDRQRIKKPSVEKHHVYLIRFIKKLHYKQKANAWNVFKIDVFTICFDKLKNPTFFKYTLDLSALCICCSLSASQQWKCQSLPKLNCLKGSKRRTLFEKIAVFRLILNIYPSIISSVAILRTSLSATNANCSIDYRNFFLQLQYVELHVPGF